MTATSRTVPMLAALTKRELAELHLVFKDARNHPHQAFRGIDAIFLELLALDDEIGAALRHRLDQEDAVHAGHAPLPDPGCRLCPSPFSPPAFARVLGLRPVCGVAWGC